MSHNRSQEIVAERPLQHADNPLDHTVRRERLAQLVGEDGVALIAATPERTRNNDVEYHYRSDSDFRYLTGFSEPQAIAVIAPGHEDGDYTLFCRERDPELETWNGRRAGTEGVKSDYGADVAYPIEMFYERLPGLLAGRKQLYLPMTSQPEFRHEVLAKLDQLPRQTRQGGGGNPPSTIVAVDDILHDWRLRKGPEELALMREAAQTSARAHRTAMQAVRPGMMEYQLAARVHYEFERDGMTWAYPSIVGGGENACILHYTENAMPLADGDLVLVDAGAEYRGYAGDITRTFPVNGKFSGPQRELYELVLDANLKGIDAARAGARADAMHQTVLRILSAGLIDLGLLKGSVDDVIEQETYRQFFMHGTGHWLGMDVHDVGDYRIEGEWRPLEPGMTLTVEPGLYVPPGADVDERFHGIGIRVEDDVCVTADGAPEIFTSDVPKAIDDIEALMQEARA